MRNYDAIRLFAVLSFFFAALINASVHAQTTSSATAALNPSAECNSLFASSGQSGSGTGSTATSSSVLNSYGLTLGSPLTATGPCFLALIVSFDVIAIGYVISKLVPASQLSGWLQKEYWELAKSVILVVSVFAVITLVSGLAVALYGSSSSVSANGPALTSGSYVTNVQSLILGAESYLCTVNNQANLSISNFAPLFSDIGLVKSINVGYAGVPIPALGVVFRSGVSLNIFRSYLISIEIVYLGPMVSIFIDFVIFLIVPIKVFFSTQVVVLPYLVVLSLTFLLPVGLVMRALPFLRGIGGTLIAFAIGIAVVWPTILILFNAPVSSYFCGLLQPSFCTNVGTTGQNSQILQQQTQANANTFCGGSLIGTVCGYVYTWISGAGSSFSNFVNPFGTAFASINSLFPSLNDLIQFNTYLVMQFYILFVLDLMIFYAVTDNIARMLGGTIKLSLGGKLSLV